jgi:PAS domain-containing protein
VYRGNLEEHSKEQGKIQWRSHFMALFSDSYDYLRSVLDAIPSMVFILDAEVRVVDANHAASRFVQNQPENMLKKLCGAAIHCINTKDDVEECGKTEFCNDCVIRNSVSKALAGQQVFREKMTFTSFSLNDNREVHFLVTASGFSHDSNRLCLLIMEDITELIELKKILPMCSNCRKIRADEQFWQQLEDYLIKHSDTRFSHSVCPECAKQLYPELFDAEDYKNPAIHVRAE